MLMANLMAALLTIGLCTSCFDEESFPTPSSARISFASDTLQFDTLISQTSSPTAQFTIYNLSSDGIEITDVRFEGSQAAQFLANVNGTEILPTTTSLPLPISCRGKDSLTAWVQFNAPELDNDVAQLCEAQLAITLANGVKQTVVCQGYSQSVVRLPHITYTADTTFAPTRPIFVEDSIIVEENTTLTIAPGATLLFAPTASLQVKGTLKANGALGSPITMRGHRYDDMFDQQPYDRIDSQWQGVSFAPSSMDNYLNYCDIHSSYYGVVCDSAPNLTDLKLKIENSILHNSRLNGLTIDQCRVEVGNSQITNAEHNCIDITGGYTRFIHCTVGWFSPFSTRQGHALVFTNHKDERACPVELMEFRNSIITGHNSDEVFGYASEDQTIANNYQFYNCLLNTPEITDTSHALNCVWETSSSEVRQAYNFVNFNYDALLYDFRLAAGSPARYVGDPAVTREYYPYDRIGRLRQTTASDVGSCAGCYEYSAEDQPQETTN